MAVLILGANGTSPISITVQSAGETAPQEIGSVTQSFNGADRSSVRGVKRNYGSLTSIVDTATKDSIISLLKWGNQIACSGDLLGNIQTQATVRYTGASMKAGLGGSFWEVGLTLSEVQPSVTLLRYAPGDTITGEIFTRSLTGYQINAAGAPVSKGVNVKRDGHYIGGVRSLLLEDTRTNNLIKANDFSNAAYAKVTMTVTTGVADPTGATAACTLTATGANAEAYQRAADAASLVRISSVWIRRRTGTGNVRVLSADGTGSQIVAVTGTWARYNPAASAASVQRWGGVRLDTNGDAVDVWLCDNEDGSFITSEIITDTVAATRGADLYSLPFTIPPTELTVYVKFVELGTIAPANGKRLFQISSAAGAVPLFMCYAPPGGFYRTYHDNGTTNVSSTVAVTPVRGDVVEIVSRLFGDGSVDTTQSINGAASTSSTQSSGNALATAWSGLLMWINSGGNNDIGFSAIQSFKVIAGARSMAEMRAA